MKCTDEKCCDPFQANWLDVSPGRFLPAPFQFRQSTGDPTVPWGSQAKLTDHFADLWKRMTINRFVTQNNYEVLPYDTYYPSMKSAVKKEYVTYVEYTTRAWQLSKDIKQEVVVQKE